MRSPPAIAASSDETAPTRLIWGLSPREAAILAAILIATIAVYLPSLRNGWVIDDWEVFVNNKLIHSWSFVTNSFRYDSWWFRKPASLPQSAFYRPLVNVWFAAMTWLFGVHPAPWHLSKIVLHVAAVLLCFRVAKLLTRDDTVALLAAAVFGFMPAQVEAVVWTSAIAEPLSTVLELGALLCVIERKPGVSGGLIGALFLYGCALLTHESSVLFPLIVGAYVFLIERGEDDNRSVAAISVAAPFVLMVIAYLCVRAQVLGLGNVLGLPQYRPPSALRGTLIPTPHHPPAQVLLTIPVVMLAYLEVEAIPGVAGPAHGLNWITRPAPIAFESAAVLLILAALSFVLIKRSPDRRLYVFCAVWSLLTIAPALNLNSILFLVHDRYLYAPSFGFSLAFALAATRIARVNRAARAAVGTATAVLLAAYLASTFRTERFWYDNVTFFRQCVAIAPTDLDYRLRLHAALNTAGDRAGALVQVQRDVEMYPDVPYLRLMLARQYQSMGRDLDFEREFQKFTELSSAMAASGSAQPASPPGAEPGETSSP